MQTLSRSELRDRLFHLRGATFVTMVARTVPTLRGGKSCPLKGLEKISRVNGLVNWSYENSVNNQRGREAEVGEQPEKFVAHPRKWGKRLHDALRLESGKQRLLPLVAYDFPVSDITLDELRKIPVDELYLEFKFERSLWHHYELNGKDIPASQVEPWLPPKRESGRQEVEKPVILRDYKLVNLQEITLGNETYALSG
jgi:hypothetical protein